MTDNGELRTPSPSTAEVDRLTDEVTHLLEQLRLVLREIGERMTEITTAEEIK